MTIAPASPTLSPKRRKRVDWSATGFVLTLLLPGTLLYVFLVLSPMVQSFWVALHRWRGVSGDMVFVGPQNFVTLASDERFRNALAHNLHFFVLVSVVVLGLSLFFSNTLAQRFWGVEGFRALFLFPNVVSVVAVSTLWMFIYNPKWGLLNATVNLFRHPGQVLNLTHSNPASSAPWLPDTIKWIPEGPAWLANPQTVMPAVCGTYVWYVLGFYILLFRAAIQGIPSEINEAALVDGATEGQRFRFVTLPLLNDVLRLAVLYLFINSMNLFALVWIMAPPDSTGQATDMALTYLYQKGFVEYQFGYSTAIGAVNFVIVMGITLVLQRAWKVREA